MPKQFKKFSPELERLVREQEREQSNSHEFSEKIDPCSPVLFRSLTASQKASFILSLFMKRKEIAQAMKIKPKTVNKHIENSLKRLPDDLIKRYADLKKIKTHSNNHWLLSASIGSNE